MARVGLFSSLILILLMGVVSAGIFSDDMIFKTEQKDYYFLVGQDAVIDFEISNDYGENVSGMLTYTFEQNGGGVTSQNVQSVSYLVEDGESVRQINFGTSGSAGDMVFGLKFSFEDQEVVLDDIGIHFVEKPEEQNNEEDSQKSSQSKQKSSEQKKSQQQQEQQSQQQSMQQKVSNSQASQNSNELKNYMEQDAKRAEEAKNKFMENLQKNEELTQAHEELMDQGFEQSGGDLSPKEGDSSSGDFRFDYKDANGESATLSGSIENGTLTDLEKTNSATKKKLENLVRADERFQNIESGLIESGFSEKNVEYSNIGNVSVVRFNYTDEFGEVEVVVAEIENDEVVKVYVDRDKDYFWLWGFLVLPVALVSFYFFRRRRRMISIDDPIVKKVRPFNHKLEARKLLKKAKVEFDKKNFKDAYGLANRAIRIFLSYKNGLDKELTNYEMLKEIGDLPRDTSKIFDLCCLVEFAKYKPNKKDFNEIVRFGEKLVK